MIINIKRKYTLVIKAKLLLRNHVFLVIKAKSLLRNHVFLVIKAKSLLLKFYVRLR
jgi:hypothetical protein